MSLSANYECKSDVNLMAFPCFSGRTLVISPHFDDACFSVGGLLLKKTSKKVVIFNVFSRGQHAPNLKLQRLFSKMVNVSNLNFFRGIIADYVSEVRRKEDQQFCDNLSAVQINLPFADASLRDPVNEYYPSFDAESIVKEPIYNDVLKAIEKTNFSTFYDSILCPLAIGDQVDHLIVVRAFLHILRKNRDTSAEVFFYEDLPYACDCELESINSLAQMRIGANNPLNIDVTIEMPLKLELMAVYRSQFSPIRKEKVSYHARRLFINETKRLDAAGYCERFWRLDPC